ncbi:MULTISPECIES: sarcosine oxidase subunit gamma [Bradyrhizobium]|uniref:sarcosine oxidase subunit gamma n=1 Tax=Bradyrhizobium elkanii TaxID=29448 RepID=UPI000420632A|nr:sarcosine oxidase subunit gamma family protein [Bradyrhizobium elkanii]
MADTALSGLSALPHIGMQTQPGGGVTITERYGLGIATMQARQGQDVSLRERIRQHFLLELPGRPAIVRTGSVSFTGIGPHHWLAVSAGGGHLFSSSLRALVTPLASVSDQSGGYVVFRVGGRAIRDTLAKGFPIDLDPRAFKPGDAATTIVSHIGATIWRCDDGADGSACFEIALFRSLSQSFWEWFVSSAAEFGYQWQGTTQQ